MAEAQLSGAGGEPGASVGCEAEAGGGAPGFRRGVEILMDLVEHAAQSLELLQVAENAVLGMTAAASVAFASAGLVLLLFLLLIMLLLPLLLLLTITLVSGLTAVYAGVSAKRS